MDDELRNSTFLHRASQAQEEDPDDYEAGPELPCGRYLGSWLSCPHSKELNGRLGCPTRRDGSTACGSPDAPASSRSEAAPDEPWGRERPHLRN
jgi:hypothetical protein